MLHNNKNISIFKNDNYQGNQNVFKQLESYLWTGFYHCDDYDNTNEAEDLKNNLTNLMNQFYAEGFSDQAKLVIEEFIFNAGEIYYENQNQFSLTHPKYLNYILLELWVPLLQESQEQNISDTHIYKFDLMAMLNNQDLFVYCFNRAKEQSADLALSVIEKPDMNGTTPLMIACKNNNQAIIGAIVKFYIEFAKKFRQLEVLSGLIEFLERHNIKNFHEMIFEVLDIPNYSKNLNFRANSQDYTKAFNQLIRPITSIDYRILQNTGIKEYFEFSEYILSQIQQTNISVYNFFIQKGFSDNFASAKTSIILSQLIQNEIYRCHDRDANLIIHKNDIDFIWHILLTQEECFYEETPNNPVIWSDPKTNNNLFRILTRGTDEIFTEALDKVATACGGRNSDRFRDLLSQNFKNNGNIFIEVCKRRDYNKFVSLITIAEEAFVENPEKLLSLITASDILHKFPRSALEYAAGFIGTEESAAGYNINLVQSFVEIVKKLIIESEKKHLTVSRSHALSSILDRAIKNRNINNIIKKCRKNLHSFTKDDEIELRRIYEYLKDELASCDSFNCKTKNNNKNDLSKNNNKGFHLFSYQNDRNFISEQDNRNKQKNNKKRLPIDDDRPRQMAKKDC